MLHFHRELDTCNDTTPMAEGSLRTVGLPGDEYTPKE